jgi:hypothetical protein
MKTTRRHLVVLLALALAACGKKHDHDHDHAGHDHGHAHVAPHGGTAVVLGDEAFHLEFVRDAAAGTLTAYVLDAHMENFVRLPAPGFEVIATAGNARHVLALAAVGSPATGETIGDTAQFEAQADWLKTTAEFDAVVTSITVRGVTFSQVKFNFPKGNEGH